MEEYENFGITLSRWYFKHKEAGLDLIMIHHTKLINSNRVLYPDTLFYGKMKEEHISH